MPNCLIYAPSESVSLDTHTWLHPIAGVPALEWFVRWLTGRVASEVGIVSHSKSGGASEIAAIARRYDARLYESSQIQTVPALVEAAEAFGFGDFALPGLCLPAAPHSLLGRVWATHVDGGHDLTFVSDVGDLLSLYVCKTSAFLGLLRSAAGQGLSDLSAVLRQAIRPRRDESCPSRRLAEYSLCKEYSIPSAAIPTPNMAMVRHSPEIQRVLAQYADDSGAAEQLDGLRALKARTVSARIEFSSRRIPYAGAGGREGHRGRGGRIRVLAVSSPSAISGAEASFCAMYAGLDHDRFDTWGLVGRAGSFARQLQSAGLRMIVPEEDFGAGTMSNMMYLDRLLAELRPDIVHVNSPSGVVVHVAKLRGIPVIQHVRLAERAVFGDGLFGCDRLVAISEFIRRELVKWDVDEKRIPVIYNGVDASLFHPGCYDKIHMRREYGIPKDAAVVVMIARFAPNKRHDLVMSAMAKLCQQRSDVALVLVGEPFRTEHVFRSVMDQIGRPPFSGRVWWIPFEADIRRIEVLADVCVLPSEREPLGRCVIESLALEVPVIISDSGGLPELIVNGREGFLIPPGDCDALVNRLDHLLANEELRKELGRAGRARVLERFTTSAQCRYISALYEQVFAEGVSVKK